MAAGNDDLASEDRPCESEVRHQLERIIGSPEFDTSQRSSDFLRFVVEQVLAGKGEAISQHAIACQVFGRDSQFSPTTDPIVRMQAGRVRRSLEHYYLTAGSGDPVLISMAKGTYAPAFEFRQTVSPASSPAPGPAPSDGWPTLLVSPLQNLTDNPTLSSLPRGWPRTSRWS